MLIIYFFKSSDHLKRFKSYLNSGYINMSSTIETEQSNKNIQQVYIENQLLVVYLAIPIVFYLLSTKLVCVFRICSIVVNLSNHAMVNLSLTISTFKANVSEKWFSRKLH